LEIAEKTTTMLVVALATIGVNLVLNVLLISRYGYPAAAASSLVSYLFYVAVVYRFSGKYIRMVVSWGSMGRIATACVVACLCYVGIRYAGESYALSGVYTAVLSTIAFALSYGVTLYATRELVAEKQQLGHWVHRFQSSQTR
jgi:peptidoglycan biosynthesis protein MviN/MurJ (putative lipid II flippase)